jgi:6-phosphogluconolactonase
MHTPDMRHAERAIFADAETLAVAAAEYCIAQARVAIAARGRFHLALAGGSTPRRLYQLLAAPAYRDRIDWRSVEIWFGDERCVPPDHADSNYRMADEAMVGKLAIPADQVHRMPADAADPQAAAADYARQLGERVPAGKLPVLDLVLLGMGPDGHTASLFPDTDILAVRDRAVAAVYVERLHAWRLSLTLPVLEQARNLLFLVAGADKAPMIGRVLGDVADAAVYPVQRIHRDGGVLWMLDEAAASGLRGAAP